MKFVSTQLCTQRIKRVLIGHGHFHIAVPLLRVFDNDVDRENAGHRVFPVLPFDRPGQQHESSALGIDGNLAGGRCSERLKELRIRAELRRMDLRETAADIDRVHIFGKLLRFQRRNEYEIGTTISEGFQILWIIEIEGSVANHRYLRS